MTTEELLGQLYDETLTGNKPAVLELTNQGLALGLGPGHAAVRGAHPPLEEVGAWFERGDFFVPDMLIAGKAMAWRGALEILRLLLAETGAQTIGKIVMGTVKGDVHDIGKNLVNIMFEALDSRSSTSASRSRRRSSSTPSRSTSPTSSGFSAFLTTTMPMFKANINALQKSGRTRSIRHGRRRPGHPGVRRRGGRRRVRGRRLRGRGPGQGTHRAAPRTCPCSINSGPELTSSSAGGERTREPPSCPRRPRPCGSATTNRSRSSASGSIPTGRKIFQQQLRQGDLSRVEIDVKEQVACGAMLLDVNMGAPLADEAELMRQAVPLIQG